MAPNKHIKHPIYLSLKGVESDRCLLRLRNRSKVTVFMVIHDVVRDRVREVSFRKSKRLNMMKGTYVIEAWLKTGNIGINPENIQHVEIENIPARHNTSFRGKRIVADLLHDRDQLIFFEEITVADIIQRGV